MTAVEMDAIVEAVSISIKTALTDAKRELREEFKAMVESRAMTPGPKGDKGEDAPPVDTDSIVLRVVELVPRPENGKDAPPVDTAAIVAEVVRQIPQPKEPPQFDVEDLAAKVVSLIGTPRDGKDVDMAEVRTLVESTIAIAVAAIPLPKDAPPVDEEAMAARILKQIPTPRDGRSVLPEDLKPIVEAEVQRAVSGLPVPKDGPPGEPGKDGESVHPDTVELMVRKAVGEVVASLPKPADGRPGADGRDAWQIDPLPMIDPARSHPKGTFAYHNGGTVRANRNTTPGESVNMAEWDVALDGWPLLDISQSDDLRTFTLTFGRTSGQQVVRSFKMPVVLDRGVYKNGDTYYRGDSVSRDGSTWICQVESTGEVPREGCPDWRLSNKRGRDGRDLRPEDLLPKSPNGPVRLK